MKKAKCIEWFIETKSDIQTERNYQTVDVDRNRMLDVITLKHSCI